MDAANARPVAARTMAMNAITVAGDDLRARLRSLSFICESLLFVWAMRDPMAQRGGRASGPHARTWRAVPDPELSKHGRERELRERLEKIKRPRTLTADGA